MNKTVLKICRELKDWVSNSDNRSFMYDDSVGILKTVGATCGSKSLAAVAGAAESISSWMGASGAAKIIEGDSSGWSRLYSALQCKVFSIRAMAHLSKIEGRNRATISAEEVGLTIATANLLGAELELSHMHAILIRRTHLIQPDMVGLLAIMRHCIFNDSPSTLGDAAPDVWRHAINEGALLPHLVELEQVHFALSNPDDSGHDVFSEYPYPLFPVEIIVFSRFFGLNDEVLWNSGVSILSTNLARIPGGVKADSDPAVQMISQKILSWGIE